MKSVAIVGGGPAGLVAAKTLLRYGKDEFQVTVFEKQDRVGGMWALQPEALHGGKCNPNMPTNLSRFSVSFSDLAWQSVDLQSPAQKGSAVLPMYPKAWQVGRYLQEYAARFIPSQCIQLHCKVEYANKELVEGKIKWHLKWSHVQTEAADENHAVQSNGSIGEGVFDHLVTCSGFFGSPRNPSFKVQTGSVPRIVHSSLFRSMEDLIPKHVEQRGNIVIVGGGMSGSEAAVAVAMAQSNASNAPESTGRVPSHNIIHITSRPFYDIPRMNPQTSSDVPDGQIDHAPGFLPNDLSMFNLSKMPPGRIVPANGLTSPENAQKGHPWMHSIIGDDQSDLGSEGLRFSETHKERPGFIGITDSYTEFVRAGLISTVLGRVTEVLPAPTEELADVVYHNEHGDAKTANGVVGIVHATGFSPQSSLSWLDESVLCDLQHDKTSERLPLVLHHHTSYNPSVPEVGFVGMYEGPFWAVMEMQAREIAKRWADSEKGKPIPLDYEEPDMLELRAAMLENRTDVPQFWMRDYLQMIESLAPRHGIERVDEGFGTRAGPVAAARYTTDKDDKDEAVKTLIDLRSVLKEQAEHNRFLGAAIFRALQGRWEITRKLESFLARFPSGTLNGHAHFHPRFPSDRKYDAEYLYIEDGTLNTDAGLTLKANKRYVYRYAEVKDQISTWFVKEDGKTVDYFFHDIKLSPRSSKSQTEGWRATGSHWCDPDQYDCNYRFKFKGARLLELTIRFVVKGPHKDYISETHFQRPSSG